jgi:signal peptidase I
MDQSEALLRKKARSRALVVPGAGFGLLGYPSLALASLLWTFLALGSIAAASFRPGPLAFWLVVGVIVVSLLVALVEIFAASRWEIRESAATAPESSTYPILIGLIAVLAVATGACVLLNFGTMVMAGQGMTPLVQSGERFVYHKRVEPSDLVPGGLVTFELSKDSSWGGPGVIVFARILGVPGDSLSKLDGYYLVNGKAGPEVSPTERGPIPLKIPEPPASIVVPADCYFVVQEQAAKSFDSQTFSWVRKGDLISTKHWLLSPRGFLQPLK